VQIWDVQATLTDLRRKAGKVIGPVIHAGQTVELTQYGQVVASIHPKPTEDKVIWGKLVEKDGMLVLDPPCEMSDAQLGKAVMDAVREHQQEIS
jgi:antitoxin (DNA-binding transcriptional repressor) of toxin-antitoxin stability system